MYMQITKRDGREEVFDSSKIYGAIKKAILSTEETFNNVLCEQLTMEVVKKIDNGQKWSVEEIQDEVEKTLMEAGLYKVAKNYILFRSTRTLKRDERLQITAEFSDVKGFDSLIIHIQTDFPDPKYSITILTDKYYAFSKPQMSVQEKLDALSKAAIESTTISSPGWEKIAGRILLFSFKYALKQRMQDRAIYSFYDKIKYLTNEGLYGSYILENYSEKEIDEAEKFIDERRNNLFTYSGLDLLLKRYVIHSHKNEPLETPQELYLGIALHLAMIEKTDRMKWVKAFYDMLSRMEVTMATPTLSNARKPMHQLSSCFVDTVPDSLDGIYRSIDNFAKVSKMGGGMGLYFGKVRANGSTIRGFEGAAGGVIRWIRIVNDTAVAVDQLGMRAGAVAVYLDVWHRDILEFLSLRTNNGDDRMKAHDVFPGVCYPDYFWKCCKEDLNQMWYLLCPHDVYTHKGYHLEDYFGEEWEKRYKECLADPRISKKPIVLKELVRLILKSAVETGTPFAFNRDTVNRTNPNKHKGIIYCSNLCTEIAQNMSAIELKSVSTVSEDGDEIVITSTKSGDLVVCNLASLCIGNFDVTDTEKLNSVVSTAVRALDNVISLNSLPIKYADITNAKYRSIGLGISGYHHALAKHGIAWESEEHLEFADKVFENIAYAAIDASSSLAKEKGAYSLFEGSAWQSGEYFDMKNYTSPKWQELKARVMKDGLRNAYLLAIAPTSSTSIISGTTAGIDPVMNKFFYEEKKGNMLPRIAPDLNAKTMWLYKSAHTINQKWSVKAAGVRARHIDQAQSMNLYITNDYSMKEVLSLYIQAWEEGVKTIYYIRSKSLEVEECSSCAS